MIKQDMKALHSLFSNISRVRKEVGESDVQVSIRQLYSKEEFLSEKTVDTDIASLDAHSTPNI
jgi:hypothetical protein